MAAPTADAGIVTLSALLAVCPLPAVCSLAHATPRQQCDGDDSDSDDGSDIEDHPLAHICTFSQGTAYN
jgi:hypothetical protein